MDSATIKLGLMCLGALLCVAALSYCLAVIIEKTTPKDNY
jgi:hypothetical protein